MKKKYRCLIKNEYTYKNYSLETIQENEIEKIRIWRNKNIKILRQTKKIEKKQQVLYFQKNIRSDMKIKQPKNILLFLNQVVRISPFSLFDYFTASSLSLRTFSN